MVHTINPDNTNKRQKSETVLSNIYALPGLPNVMFEATRLLDDPSTTTATLSKIIGRDQGLATKLLSIANSTLYGLPRKVSTIDFAILVIGYKDTKNIIIALSLMEAFKNKNDAYLNYHDLWMHSYLVGGIAKRIAADLGCRLAGEAYVGGLLHDLGIPVIHKYLHTGFISILDMMAQTNCTALEAETEVLGLTHQEVGKFLTEKWNLPAVLVDVVANHHQPMQAKVDPELCAIIHLSDYLVNHLHCGDLFYDTGITLDLQAVERFGFKEEKQVLDFIADYAPLLTQELQTFKF